MKQAETSRSVTLAPSLVAELDALVELVRVGPETRRAGLSSVRRGGPRAEFSSMVHLALERGIREILDERGRMHALALSATVDCYGLVQTDSGKDDFLDPGLPGFIRQLAANPGTGGMADLAREYLDLLAVMERSGFAYWRLAVLGDELRYTWRRIVRGRILSFRLPAEHPAAGSGA